MPDVPQTIASTAAGSPRRGTGKILRSLAWMLAAGLLLGLLGLNAAVVAVWLPHVRELEARGALEKFGVAVEGAPLVPPPVYNAARRILPRRHDGVFYRVHTARLPEGPLTDDGRRVIVQQLEGFADLRILDASRCDDAQRLLAGLNDSVPGLRRLSLDDTSVGDGDIQVLGLRRLERLSLCNTRIRDGGLRHLASLTGLRQLRLGGTAVTLAGLAHLESLPQLEVLDVRGIAALGSAELRAGGMPPLRELCLAETDLTDESLGRILRWAPRLESLDLTGTRITDQSGPALLELSHLRQLQVADTRVSQGFVQAMAMLPTLNLVVCDRAAASEEFLRALEASRPNLLVFSR